MTTSYGLRRVEPRQLLVLDATCNQRTELGPNEELWLWHAGEDGWVPYIAVTREFNLDWQVGPFSAFQRWYNDEQFDLFMLGCDAEE